MSRARARPALVLALLVPLLAVAVPPVGAVVVPAHLARIGPTEAGRTAVATDAIALGPSDVPDGAIPTSAPVTLEIALAPSNASDLAAFDAAVIDPVSPLYRHFLTEPQYEARYRPSAAEVVEVERYFAGFGGVAQGTTVDRLGLSERLSAGAVEQALGVRLIGYRVPDGRPGLTALGTATVPSALAPSISGIDGLADVPPAGSTLNLDRVATGRLPVRADPGEIVTNVSSGQWWFTGTDYAQAYQMGRLFPGSSAVANTTFATGEAVATILMSGYNVTTGENLPPFDPTAVAQYFNDTFPVGWPQPTVLGVPLELNNVPAPVPSSNGPLNDSTGNVEENSIDLEMAGSLAPGATVANFYFAASLFENAPTNQTGYSDTADDFAQALATALNYSYGSARLASVTNSYGLPDLSDSLWNAELAHAAAIGVTVVAASGDQGDAPNSVSGRFQGPDPTWPASAANNTTGVIAVGGTTVNLTGTPNGAFYPNGTLNDSFDASVTGFSEQTAWYDTLGPNVSGSEGGASIVYPEPGWQRESAAQPTIVNATVAEGLETLGRAEPDVAFPANTTLAYLGEEDDTIVFDVFEGTSISAPIFAGFLAELAAVAGHPFGFIDPELYRIGSYYAANPGSGDPFLDVTTGHNYLFQAGPGWDAVTGWGSMDPVRFLQADADPAVADYNYTGPSPGLPPPAPPPAPVNMLRAYEILAAVLIVGITIMIASVVLVSRARRPSGYAGAPPGVYAPTPGGPPPPYGSQGYSGPPATFLCPYCGSVRPAEPVRCPSCGAY